MKSKVRHFHAKVLAHAKNHQVKFRFVVVGVWNSIFGYLTFYFLETVLSGIPEIGAYAYMPAVIVSNIFAVLMAYTLHRNITFRSTTQGIYLVKEFGRFVLGNMAAIASNILLLPVFVELLGVRPKLAAFEVAMLCTIVSYYAHSRVTFSSKNRVPMD